MVQVPTVRSIGHSPVPQRVQAGYRPHSGRVGPLLSEMKSNQHQAALRFLKENPFTFFSRETASIFSRRVEELSQAGIGGYYIHPLSGEFKNSAFTARSIVGYAKGLDHMHASRLPEVECGLYELINSKAGDLWMDNLIPIMGGEIYHGNGQPLSEAELARAGLRKVVDAAGTHVKMKLFATGGRVASLPGPWVVPYLETGEGVMLLKNLEDVSRVAGREVERQEVREVLISLAERGVIKLKLASDLEFKGAGCHYLPERSGATSEIQKRFHARPVYVPGVLYDQRAHDFQPNQTTNGGIGAAYENIAASLPFEEKARAGGAVFVSDTVKVQKLFDVTTLPEIAEQKAAEKNYQEVWYGVRLNYNTFRASAWTKDNREWKCFEGNEKLLDALLKDMFPALSPAERRETYLTLAASVFARNMKVFHPERVCRPWTSEVPSNYGLFFEMVDTDADSIRPAIAADKDREFEKAWQPVYFALFGLPVNKGKDLNQEGKYFLRSFAETLGRTIDLTPKHIFVEDIFKLLA